MKDRPSATGCIAQLAASRERARPSERPCQSPSLRGARQACRGRQDGHCPSQSGARQCECDAGPGFRCKAGDRGPASQARRAGDDPCVAGPAKNCSVDRQTDALDETAERCRIGQHLRRSHRPQQRRREDRHRHRSHRRRPTARLSRPSSVSGRFSGSARRRWQCLSPRCRSRDATTIGTWSSRGRGMR